MRPHHRLRARRWVGRAKRREQRTREQHRVPVLGAAVPELAKSYDALLARIVPTPRVVDITAADGRTPLNALYFAPLDSQPGPHPVITMAYGGPGTSTEVLSFFAIPPFSTETLLQAAKP